MNTYAETKDTITLTTNSVSVGQGSFIQLRLRSKSRMPILLTCNGEEFQIASGNVTPMLDGTVVVYKDSAEVEVFIERSTYVVISKVDIDEGYAIIRNRIGAGGIQVLYGEIAIISSGVNPPDDGDGKPDGSIYFQL